MKQTKQKHTAGAIRAAEIITGYKYNEQKYIPTEYGRKTTEGVADLIDRETSTPDLLEACKYVVQYHREHDSGEGELFGLDFVTTCINAIAKAEGNQ